MPRNLERELLRHSLLRAEIQARTYAMLRDQLPDRDRALIGWPAILEYLHDTLGLRRLNGGRLTHRIVLRWCRARECPVVRGYSSRRGGSSPCFSTSYALTAWSLAAFATGIDYRVGSAVQCPVSGRLSPYAARVGRWDARQRNAA